MSESPAEEIPRIELDASAESGSGGASSSECESEISRISESWALGPVDKHGRSYSRIDTKMTAEGRLRSAMFQRVKRQVKLMRQDSAYFSVSMTDYARKILEPKFLPIYTLIKANFDELEKKYGLIEIFEQIQKFIQTHYILAIPFRIWISMLLVPINMINQIFFPNPKRRSRRARSMRSESLRNRTPGSPINLSLTLTKPKTKELDSPDSPEDTDFVALAKLKKSLKGSSESNRDSAIASSVDELTNSDSNGGGIAGSLQKQTIYEEDYKKEHDDINKWIQNHNKDREEMDNTENVTDQVTEVKIVPETKNEDKISEEIDVDGNAPETKDEENIPDKKNEENTPENVEIPNGTKTRESKTRSRRESKDSTSSSSSSSSTDSSEKSIIEVESPTTSRGRKVRKTEDSLSNGNGGAIAKLMSILKRESDTDSSNNKRDSDCESLKSIPKRDSDCESVKSSCLKRDSDCERTPKSKRRISFSLDQ